jgi:antitoxin component YwqK of YwqJK toxin-antitoxin module
MKDAKIQWMIVLTLLAVCLGACKDHDTHYEYYDKDGSKPFKVFEVDRATGKMDGSFKQFNRMGILVKEGTYENGLKNGVFKEYSKNGSLVLEGSYDHDLKNGTFR